MKDYIDRIREIRPFQAGLMLTAFLLSISFLRYVLSSGWIYESSDFYAVWGNSASNIFAVGRYGAILHYDGVSWPPKASGADSCASGMRLQDVWGISATDLYADGDVDGMEIHIFLGDWQRIDCCDSEAEACEGDLNHSCTME